MMSSEMNKSLLLFSGYNQRAILTFLRTLRTQKITSYIVARDKNDEIFHTDFANDVIHTRKHRELYSAEIIECLDKIFEISNNSQFIVIPSSEALNRYFLENIDLFNKKYNFYAL